MSLPEQHTDSLLLVFHEEFGVVGSYALWMLATLLLWGGVYVVLRWFAKKRQSEGGAQ